MLCNEIMLHTVCTTHTAAAKKQVFSSLFLPQRHPLVFPACHKRLIARLVHENLYLESEWPSFHGLSNHRMIPPSGGGGGLGRWVVGGGVKPRPSHWNLLWVVSSINYLLLEVRACIHMSVSGVETKGSVVCCLFVFTVGVGWRGCVTEVFQTALRWKKRRKKNISKRSFYTAYNSNDIIFFPPKGWLRVAHQLWQRHGLTTHVIETIDCNFINTNVHKARSR